MQDKYNKFLEEQEEIDQQREKAQSQVYTITN
jgi:hypothetical protein